MSKKAIFARGVDTSGSSQAVANKKNDPTNQTLAQIIVLANVGCPWPKPCNIRHCVAHGDIFISDTFLNIKLSSTMKAQSMHPVCDSNEMFPCICANVVL